MTDSRMDARLRTAGQRWRAQNAAPAEVAEPVLIVDAHPEPPQHRRWLALLSAAVVAAALVVGAVLFAAQRHSHGGNAPATPAARLTGAWAFAGSPAVSTMTFAAGTVQVVIGCQRLSWHYQVHGDRLTFGPTAGPGLACSQILSDPRQAAIEHRVSQVLSGTVRWSVTGDRLTLTKPGSGTVSYVRAQPLKILGVRSLTGRTWALTSVRFGDDVYAQPRKPPIASNLTFAHGRFKATHRCYTRVGRATTGLGSVAFSSAREIDAVPCPQLPGKEAAASEEDQAIDTVLTGTAQYTLAGARLTLRKDGARLVYSATG
jgi:heat shock protein HslJ